jgi:hypothetical protein
MSPSSPIRARRKRMQMSLRGVLCRSNLLKEVETRSEIASLRNDSLMAFLDSLGPRA